MKKLLQVSGDKDFIMSDNGLLIYYDDPYHQTTHRVFISNNQLAQLHGEIPFKELVEKHKRELAQQRKQDEEDKKYPPIYT